MFFISRMKSVISPTLSTLTPSFSLSKPKSFPFFSIPSQSLLSNFQNPKFFPTISSPNLTPLRCLHTNNNPPSQSPSGEIHVIVGPMFAGKTTTLLHRIKSERSNGRFQDRVSDFRYMDKTLRGLCCSGRVSQAVGILCRTGIQVESETYSLLLQECIFRKDYRMGRRIHSQMIMVGFFPNEYIQTKLLILYAKAGDLDTAHILLNRLLTKSLVSWNAMIAGYVQKGLEEMGLNLYYKMRRFGLMPDQYTFASVFRACATLARLEQGRQAHCVLIKSQSWGNVVVNSALIDMYFKCSCPCDGRLVFDKAMDKNVVTWSSLISGYGQQGRVKEVLEAYHRMINEGCRPNYVTFLAVLSACSHGGLVDEGWGYFLSMSRDYGIQPREKHYASMVDLLGRAGRLQEAYDFIRNSPCKEHPIIWGALLEACKIHGNMDLAKIAAKNYYELEPENASKYIVLSNAYASFGQWKSVAEIRTGMKECGMKKEPGYSMIEVQKEVHYFFKGHTAHEQTLQLYELIKDMDCILNDAGYFPDLIAASM